MRRYVGDLPDDSVNSGAPATWIPTIAICSSEAKATIAFLDGVSLAAEIYHPQHTVHSPTILVRIPLTKDFKNDLFASVVGKMWAERGYTAIIQERAADSVPAASLSAPGERQDGIENIELDCTTARYNGQVLAGEALLRPHSVGGCGSSQSWANRAYHLLLGTNFHDMFFPAVHSSIVR